MSLEGWKTFFEIGGVILLFLTFVFGAGAVLIGKKINALQAEEVRQFNIKLAAQQERAANAEHDAAEAKTTAANANDRTLALEADAANAKASQQRVETDLAKQQERTAIAERDLLVLQEKIKTRRLSEEQKQELVRLLAGQPPATPIIAWVQSAVDGEIYSLDFADVFRRLGWTVTPQNMRMTFVNTASFTGVSIIINDRNTLPPQAEALRLALKAIGVESSVNVGPSFPDATSTTFTIMIGSKN
jgi:hypothetical protein